VLNTDLIDVVNGGEAWALVGSGASTDAGAPGWRRLVESCVDSLDPVPRSEVIADARLADSLSKADFPRAFSRIEAIAGREALEHGVGSALGIPGLSPGPLLRHTAAWPFRGYLTSNYDTLLEHALSTVDRGWIPIGNLGDEIRKLGGGARRLVWHFHGAQGMDPKRSRLILTEADYDNVYLEDSPLLGQLRAFFQMHRLVIFGFGFRDAELLRLLRITARYCTPARPAFAFLAGVDESRRADLRERYNVEAIPYTSVGGSHAALGPLLETYGAFTLKRTLRFGRPSRPVPSYDPETAGLMVYNELVLKGGARAGRQSVDALLRARTLAMLKFQGPLPARSLVEDLSTKAALITDRSMAATDQEDRVMFVLDALTADGFVSSQEHGDDRLFGLTDSGRALIDQQAAQANVLSEQFSMSLLDRARRLTTEEEAAKRIATAAEAFIKQ
jgi:hypothetical protein